MKDSVHPFKDKEFSLNFFRTMVRIRALEEKLVKMARTGDGFFWIGGPGEEAFSVALGWMIQKGEGVDFDYLHFHYRNNGVALAMGAPMIEMIRQMRSSHLDTHSGGRNFVAHLARRDWNIVPVTSTIETQFVIGLGTALAQRRHRVKTGHSGVTIVIGGDAGTAEGDFASSLIWSSRPEAELPMLMIVTNNGYGISTPSQTQYAGRNIADRAKAFGIEHLVVDGRSPERVWSALRDALHYVRHKNKPFLLEILVSRLLGHSSSSGANRTGEECPLESFEKHLTKQGWLNEELLKSYWGEAVREANEAHEAVRHEPYPDPSTVHEHTFAGLRGGGLPGKEI